MNILDLTWPAAQAYVRRSTDEALRADLAVLTEYGKARPQAWDLAIRPFVRLVVREQLRRVAARS